jgi:hypothetical protein
MRIDRKKLKAAIKEVESTGRQSVWTWKEQSAAKMGFVKFFTATRPEGWTFNATDAQLLYAIAAHARGKLSIQKMWIPLGGTVTGLELMPFTMEMQTALIGEGMKFFTRPELVGASEAQVASQVPA